MYTRLNYYLFALMIITISCTNTSQQQDQEQHGSAGVSGADDQADRRSEEWVQLFNGKDLDGWTAKIRGYETGENYGNTFRVEDGVMKVVYDQYDDFKQQYGHIFYKQPFSNYKLRVEYRFVGEQAPGGEGWALRNSGIMIHGQSPESMGVNQDFPISIEVQLLGGTGEGERSTANLCTPGTEVYINNQLITDHCISSSSKTYNGEQWVTAEVEVHGNRLIKHIVEGDTVMVYERPQVGGGNVSGLKKGVKKDGTPLSGGYISLQSESHPVEFRKVELLELKE